MSSETDEQLMSRLKQGDGHAMRELFDRHHRQLFGFILGRLACGDRAEDLTQEVFIKVWRYRGSFDSTRPFLPWFYRIARNRLADSSSGPVGAPLNGEGVSGRPQPDEQAEVNQLAAEVRRAVLQLPENQREVLLLSRWSGMSYREIGQVLGCSEGAVKVRVFRGLEALRSTLAPLREDLQ